MSTSLFHWLIHKVEEFHPLLQKQILVYKEFIIGIYNYNKEVPQHDDKYSSLWAI